MNNTIERYKSVMRHLEQAANAAHLAKDHHLLDRINCLRFDVGGMITEIATNRVLCPSCGGGPLRTRCEVCSQIGSVIA